MFKINNLFFISLKIIYLFFLAGPFLSSCQDKPHVHIGEKEIVQKPEEISEKAEDIIKGTLKDIIQNNKELSDSFKVKNAGILDSVYGQFDYRPIWSADGKFSITADSLISFIGASRNYGLFPEDYYYKRLSRLRGQLVDTVAKDKKMDASLWAYTDMLLSSAFIQLVKDIKVGRLLPDSIIAQDSSLNKDFYLDQLKYFESNGGDAFASRLAPSNPGYHKMILALKTFLHKANLRSYTIINTKDSSKIPQLLFKRYKEEDSTYKIPANPDSAALEFVIRKLQKKKGLKVDGKISQALISALNTTDKEKFIRVAITLDRYKQDSVLPQQYIWVNLPSYYMKLVENDSVILISRVVVGKPETRTPIITSAISNMVTYPKWHIPESIIKKDILPGLKRDKGYIARKGFHLVDEKDNEIDPYTINWSKYKNSIPYKVVQGSGDDNALGVLKFNFPNRYAVYLHDTNQRYLFGKSARALSHGCVRVQEWKKLADYILRNDSAAYVISDTVGVTVTGDPGLSPPKLPPNVNLISIDTLNSWLAMKEKHVIPVHKQIPVFFRYFTCDVVKDHLVFYEDIYGEDKRIRDKIFANK